MTVSAGSDVSHLSAAATLTLSPTTIPSGDANSLNGPRKSGSALSGGLMSGTSLWMSCTIAALSWILSDYLF